MINKNNLWFLTLFSLILILGVYYVTLPSDVLDKIKIKDKVERYNMYEFLYHLEFNMLGLVKPDKVIFLHMPYLYAKELKQNRKSLDGHEKDEEHLQMAESSYLELRDKFNFSYVICVKEHEIRDIEDINNEVLDIILK